MKNESKHNQILNNTKSLAALLKQSKEYNQYLMAKEKLEQDEFNINVLKEIKNQELHIRMNGLMREDAVNTEELLEEMYMALSLNPVVSEYLNAEYSFSRLLEEMQKIFGDILGIGQETVDVLPVLGEGKPDKLIN